MYCTTLHGSFSIHRQLLLHGFIRKSRETPLAELRLARRMKTSRAFVRRLLDAKDSSITLTTISRAALALGKQVEFRLVA